MRHINIDAPVAAPVPVQTLVTGQLNLTFGGERPQLRLVRLSTGAFAVQYSAHGQTFGKVFDDPDRARRYFATLTGERPAGRRTVP